MATTIEPSQNQRGFSDQSILKINVKNNDTPIINNHFNV